MSKLSTPSSIKISVCARASPLSRAQEREVFNEIRQCVPEILFETRFLATTGDNDRTTSLRTLDKTDFFTKELDELLLKGDCRIAIHSAKDLPDPIPAGLKIIAITRGIDSSDSLVLREGESLQTLPSGAKIATSSERREAMVRQLREDLTFIDIRGTIEERIRKLNSGEADGVVIAEAALIRLNLNPNRITLPGETTPGQGQLAILARSDDVEMETLFSQIDTRPVSLYLGLSAPFDPLKKTLHYPIIKIVPRPIENIPDIDSFSHLIFTSKSAVDIFFSHICHIRNIHVLAVGTATASRILSYGCPVHLIAAQEQAEGIVDLLKNLKPGKVLWPRAALARPIISDYLAANQIPYEEWILYDTAPHTPHPFPDLNKVDEIVFTSPSTVSAFFSHVKMIPPHIKLIPIGPITKESLDATYPTPL